jgi:hypothetical protein
MSVDHHPVAGSAVEEPADIVLGSQQWRPLQQRYLQRVSPWIQPRLQRRKAGQRHPVDDFLFEYYRLSPRQLSIWHPGWRYTVIGNDQLEASSGYCQRGEGYGAAPKLADRQLERLRRSIRLLRATATRPAEFSCFGMHEWAMVYRTNQIRHAQVPLRLSSDQIAAAVDDVGLRCTHFDAYRFFSGPAQSRQLRLTRAGQEDLEQPGCIHAGMDLYRYAYEALPLVSSELVADCFEFARAAREVDMRSSPYDLTGWGLSPIRVETAAGRSEHATEQRRLAERSGVLRKQLVAELELAHDWVMLGNGIS